MSHHVGYRSLTVFEWHLTYISNPPSSQAYAYSSDLPNQKPWSLFHTPFPPSFNQSCCLVNLLMISQIHPSSRIVIERNNGHLFRDRNKRIITDLKSKRALDSLLFQLSCFVNLRFGS